MTLKPLPLDRPGAARISTFQTTVFTVWTRLANEHKAINLGQGFPDFLPPSFVLEAGRRALEQAHLQQYAPLPGVPVLRQALAEDALRSWGRSVHPDTEITVTVGATEGIFATVLALIDPGDEVLLLEPFYDSYPASVLMAGGIPRCVPLRPDPSGVWLLDFDELRKAFSKKTKLLILNTPQNPIGKCFSQDELRQIAALCQEFDTLVISDEVYDRIVFDGHTHHSIATLPGMWDRTVTLGSAGKTFSVTGWKIGWAIAPPPLTHAIQMAHQWIPFSVSTPLQYAVAEILRLAAQTGYYQDLHRMYQDKRDRFLAVLREVGLQPIVPQGTYFIVADFSPWGFQTDQDFCHFLTTKVGVVAIPPSYFFSPPHQSIAHRLARFAFCKEDAILEEAAARLRRHAAGGS